jgi:hypothetical protein
MSKAEMVAEIQLAMAQLRPVVQAARDAGDDEVASALMRQVDNLWRVAAAIHNDVPVEKLSLVASRRP